MSTSASWSSVVDHNGHRLTVGQLDLLTAVRAHKSALSAPPSTWALMRFLMKERKYIYYHCETLEHRGLLVLDRSRRPFRVTLTEDAENIFSPPSERRTTRKAAPKAPVECHACGSQKCSSPLGTKACVLRTIDRELSIAGWQLCTREEGRLLKLADVPSRYVRKYRSARKAGEECFAPADGLSYWRMHCHGWNFRDLQQFVAGRSAPWPEFPAARYAELSMMLERFDVLRVLSG
jgi:hypothetical protein